jgi:hypothetical protein
MHIRMAKFVFVCSCVLSNLFGYPAKANVFGDIWGIATDPLKLDRSSKTLADSLARTMLQLKELEKQVNYDATARLEQIRSIVQEALRGSEAAIERAERAMLTLEQQINQDAINLLFRAQCAVEVALMDQAQRAFAAFIGNLIKADPSVKILGIKVIDLGANNIQITDPDQAYISSKSAALTALNQNQKDNSRAYSILSVYQNLERGARFTRCAYMGQGLEWRWVKEINELELLSLPWLTVVEPKM